MNIKYSFHTLTLTVVIIVVGFCFIFITSFSFDDVHDTLGFTEHHPCDWASWIQNALWNEQVCRSSCIAIAVYYNNTKSFGSHNKFRNYCYGHFTHMTLNAQPQGGHLSEDDMTIIVFFKIVSTKRLTCIIIITIDTYKHQSHIFRNLCKWKRAHVCAQICYNAASNQ